MSRKSTTDWDEAYRELLGDDGVTDVEVADDFSMPDQPRKYVTCTGSGNTARATVQIHLAGGEPKNSGN
jgi:hypothetical protein